MKQITTSAELQMAIKQLELQQANELFFLKEEFHATADRLKPLNIIKRTFKNAVAAPDVKTTVMNAAIGLATGIVTKKLMIGKTFNPFKKILGVFIEMAVANKVSNNADDIKSTGAAILKKLFRKK
ncbi:MAG: hypothetical protein ABIN74_14675, partial [Ferruginibacter sp.]